SPNTTGVTRIPQRQQPIITGDARQRGNWTKSSGWRKNAWSAKTGWCATITDCCNWNGPADPGYRLRVGCWCGKTKRGKWRFTIAITVWCSANGRRLLQRGAREEGLPPPPPPPPPDKKIPSPPPL